MDGEGMNVGNLQHPAISQGPCMIGGRDGKGMCVLVEQFASAQQLWE